MDIIRTGIGLTKTVRNVGRFREIISIFWKHGLDEFIVKTNLHKVIPGFVIPKKRITAALEESSSKTFWESLGFRLRKSFEELGPSFIKLGQLLATREDLFDPKLIEELKKLQNKVQPIPFPESRTIIESSLGKQLTDVFSEFDENPIGVASIGIAYRAKLVSGEEVVVKVRRPNVEHDLSTDFEIIRFIVDQLQKVSEDIKYLGVDRAIDDFFKSIELELNFLIEAQNGTKLKENIAKIDKKNIFHLPKVYKEYAREDVLVMEFLDGKPFNEIFNLSAEAPDLEYKLIEAVKMFTHTMLADGFFHADLHGGNFFLMKNHQIGIIDFGLMGNLTRKNRTNLVAILYALVTNNYENLVFEFLDVAEYEVIPRHEILQRDVQDVLAPFMGLDVQDMDVTKLVNAIVTTLSSHQIYLPREWFIIFRSLMTLDGVGKSVGIRLNIFEVIDSEITGIMKDLVSKEALLEDAVWIGRDTLNSFRIIPRHLRWLLKEFARKKYRIDMQLEGVNDRLQEISKSTFSLGLFVLSSVLILAGSLFVDNASVKKITELPTLSLVFWGLALALILRAFR